MHDQIFTGRAKAYNEAILKTLFYKEDLTCQEIARELYVIFNKVKEGKKILAKEIKPISDNLSGSKGRLKDLTAKEFIQQTITKKTGEHKYKNEGDRYSLTRNKGFYTALMLLNKEEVSQLSLTDFQDVSFSTEFYLAVKLIDEEDNFTTKETYYRIHNSFNRLLRDKYDLKKISNEQFNRCIRVEYDSSIGVALLSEEVLEKLGKSSKDVRVRYFEFLEEAKNYANQMEEQTQNMIDQLNTELDAYLKYWTLADSYQKKLKIIEKIQPSPANRKETTRNRGRK